MNLVYIINAMQPLYTPFLCKEIAAKFEVLLSRYYVDPKVNVVVAGYRSKKYYVYGQVEGAGVKSYTGRDTLLDAVLRSVPDFRSWTSRVKVIRPSHGDVPVRTIRVNVDRMVKVGDWSKNILLEPDDIVYIPPTVGAWLTRTITRSSERCRGSVWWCGTRRAHLRATGGVRRAFTRRP